MAESEETGVDVAFLRKLIVPVFQRLRDYSRLKVDGLDHVPSEGPALLVANHTGWLGLDYAFTALSVHEGIDRIVRGMAHPAWFANAATAKFATRCGITQITKDAIREQIDDGRLVLMFPEGEKGAFRPGSDYQLEPFARGFIRIALETGAPVVPVCILGGEEANPVGTRIESYEELVNMKGGLPIPRNLIPKPVKWRIRFLPAQTFDQGAEAAGDHDLVHGLAEATRATIQAELKKLKLERGHPYF